MCCNKGIGNFSNLEIILYLTKTNFVNLTNFLQNYFENYSL